MLIAEDVLLLLIRPDKGSLRTSHPEVVLGGALLSELALLGAVEPVERRRFRSVGVRPVAGADVPDPLLRAALAEVVERPRCARDLVGRLGRHQLDTLADRLAAQGIVTTWEARVLGLFRRCRWSLADPALRQRVVQELEEALVAPLEPDRRSRAVLALLSAAGPVDHILTPPGLHGRDVRRRARELARDDWAAHAVREAIRTTETGSVASGAVVSTG